MTFNTPPKDMIDGFRRRVNRMYTDFDGKWSLEDLQKHDYKLEEVAPALQEWERRGYIKILNNEECFFKSVDVVPENWQSH